MGRTGVVAVRGTWQGGGTWQSSGGGGGIALAAVAVIVVAGLAEWVIARVWWILASTVVVVALAVGGVLWLMRWLIRRQERHETAHALQHPLMLAREAPAAVRPAARPGIGGDVHIHLHGLPVDEQAGVIRQALNGRNNQQ
jgi:hypothetical protein